MLTNVNVKALVGAFNQEKALVGAFCVITTLCVDLRFKLQSPPAGGGGHGRSQGSGGVVRLQVQCLNRVENFTFQMTCIMNFMRGLIHDFNASQIWHKIQTLYYRTLFIFVPAYSHNTTRIFQIYVFWKKDTNMIEISAQATSVGCCSCCPHCQHSCTISLCWREYPAFCLWKIFVLL